MKGFQSTEHDYFHVLPDVLPDDHETSGPPFACAYANYKNAGNALAVADEDGRVTVINTAYNNVDDCAENRVSWTAHDNAIMDLQWTLDDERILSASSDNSALPVYSITGAHSVSGTPRRPKKGKSIANLPSKQCNFSGIPCPRCIPCLFRFGDGTVKLWDLRFIKRHYGMRISEPVDRSHIVSGNKRSYDNSIFACSRDGHLYEYRTSSLQEPIAKYSDSNLQIRSYFVRAAVSPDGRFVACGSSDKAVHMWEVGGSQRPSAIFKVHEREATCIAWHKRRAEQFATVSDDVTVRIWNMRRGQGNVTDPDEDGKKWLRSTVEDGEQSNCTATSRLAAYLARKRKPQQFDSQLSQLSSEFDSPSIETFSSPFAVRMGLGNASVTPYSVARQDIGKSKSPWILSGTSRVMDDKENESTPAHAKRVRRSLTSPTRI
ncbi:WD40-repeat-containing domain protein [Cladochytrium replicatum]|nr:WD40-repeat-containing domain protein [Cladochytrium replicatum]